MNHLLKITIDTLEKSLKFLSHSHHNYKCFQTEKCECICGLSMNISEINNSLNEIKKAQKELTV